MATKTIVLETTNVLMNGDYTARFFVGSERVPANLILDTGSSTLALDWTVYNPSHDAEAKPTQLAQEVSYISGNWMGAVVETVFGERRGLNLAGTNVAVAYHESQNMFGKADGILGLAYYGLNRAYCLPSLTWPPRYTYAQIAQGRPTFLLPFFTQLDRSGEVANKFAIYALRSKVSHATPQPDQDPLNKGSFILGGGENMTQYYDGDFQTAAVVDDYYYNTNLKSVSVGHAEPIPVPNAPGSRSNSFVDSGTNSFRFAQSVYAAMLAQFARHGGGYVASLQQRVMPTRFLDLPSWPDLTFVLQGDTSDVTLTVEPETYWQVDSPQAGFSETVLFPRTDSTQSILGLPLLNNYFTVFDRSEGGRGVIRFAPIAPPCRA